MPQTLLAFESANPLWGRTLNPWSTGHTAGGSSGGEGALLAVDGAALGVGTDVGGSIRIPSAYCGIYGLKPGEGRVAYSGSVGASFGVAQSAGQFLTDASWVLLFSCAAEGPNPGFEAVRAVAGPMGRSVGDLERMARVLFGERGGREDYFPVPVPYRDVTLPEKLRFGYYLNGASSAAYNKCGVGVYGYETDGMVKGSPACHRAVLETVETLRKAGHECVEMDPPDGVTKSLYSYWKTKVWF